MEDPMMAQFNMLILSSSMKSHCVAVKSPQVQEGGIYMISRFRVSNAKQAFRAVEARFMIEFTCRTRIEPARNSAPGFPRITYSLTPIDRLKPLAGDTRSFVDTIGLLVEVSESYMVRLPNKANRTLTRNLVLRDSGFSEMKVTLWGERAAAFDVDQLLVQTDGKPIIVLLVGCLMKKYLQVYYLSGNTAARWYINPQIPEATDIYNRFKDQIIQIRRVPAPAQEQTEVKAPTDLDMKTLSDMNEMDPYDFPESGYRCTVTIARLVPNVSWWFASCTKCSKSCAQDGSGYRCNPCGSNSFRFKYKLCFIAHDGTEEAEMICFGDVGRHIVGKPVQQVLKAVTPGNPVPPAISNTVSQTFTIVVTLTQQSYYKQEKTYQVTSVVSSHGQQDIPPIAPPNVDGEASGDASPAAQNVLEVANSSYTDQLQLTPSDAALLSASNATPPPSLTSTGAQLAKDPPLKKPGTGERPSACKRLFTDGEDDEVETSTKEKPVTADVPPVEKKRSRVERATAE